MGVEKSRHSSKRITTLKGKYSGILCNQINCKNQYTVLKNTCNAQIFPECLSCGRLCLNIISIAIYTYYLTNVLTMLLLQVRIHTFTHTHK